MACYGLEITTAPATEPVTVAELKKQLEIPSSDASHDTHCGSLITQARELFERETDHITINTTYSFTFDDFPSFNIYLPKSPVSSVTSITYDDTDGASQTLATTVYKENLKRQPPMLSLKSGQLWPGVYNQASSVAIVFVAGYGANASDVPELIKQGILLLAASWFEQREEVTSESLSSLPMGTKRIIEMYKVGHGYHDFTQVTN